MREIYYGRIPANRFSSIYGEAFVALHQSYHNAVLITEQAILAGNPDYKKIAKDAYKAYHWTYKLAMEFVHIKLYPDGYFEENKFPFNVTLETIFDSICEEARQKRLFLDAQ